MRRLILDQLCHWLKQPNRKSLVLRGPRQVGKTWVVREFAKAQGLELVEINFERDAKLRKVFEQDLDPRKLMSSLEIILDRRIDIAKAILFFDEVQDCPRALTALKHFSDSELKLPVIAAGSYLGLFEGAVEGVSQPIGYTNDLKMFPMTFLEFLWAAEPPEALLDCYHKRDLSNIAHSALLQHYRDYLFVGGMPEIVNTWFQLKRETGSLLVQANAVRDLQKNLLGRYKADFAKYHPRDALQIARTWEIVAEQLARSFSEVSRFQFKGAIPGKRDYKAFANYFARLEAAGLIHRSYIIEEPGYPLKAFKKESFFKCYYGDTGLLLAEMDVAYRALDPSADVSYKGPLAENFVANALVRLNFPLFAYVRSRADAEIEFLIQHETAVIPIEVKNNQTTAKSLRWYREQFKPPFALKFSQKLGGLDGDIRHYPIYVCDGIFQELQLGNE